MPKIQAFARPSELSVVIVNYNSLDDCKGCVQSLLEFDIVSRENIIVVDNDSADRSGQLLFAELPGSKVILSGRNGGFGFGVNRGIAAATTPLVLVLNPDTRFMENRVALAVAQFEQDPRLGVLGLNLQNEDGSLQYSARRFYSFETVLARRTFLKRMPRWQRLSDEHLMCSAWNQTVFDADWVLGTGFMVRRELYANIGGMDEAFFLYLEDTDLCWRVWQAGYSVKAIRDVRLVHTHQRKSATSQFSAAARTHLRSLAVFVRKHGLRLIEHTARPRAPGH